MATPEDEDVSEQAEDAAFSQEDFLFLTKAEGWNRHKSDAQLEMPLPFKQERLPNNTSCAGPDFLWKEQLPLGDKTVGEVDGDDPELRRVQSTMTTAISCSF